MAARRHRHRRHLHRPRPSRRPRSHFPSDGSEYTLRPRPGARRLRGPGLRAGGACLPHADANPVHELGVREILLEELPGAVVSISSEVWPEYREYERTVTTLVDAFVKPHVLGYLGRAEAQLA